MTTIDPARAILRGSGISAVRRIAAARGVELPERSTAADARIAELKAIADLADPPAPAFDAPGIGKAIAKFAAERHRIAGERAIAAELLPAAQAAADDFLTEDGVAAVVDALIEDFDQQVGIARAAAAIAPDVPENQLAGLSVDQFDQRGKLHVSVARLEKIIDDRHTIASLIGEPLNVSTNLRRWGSFPILVAVLSPPPSETRALHDGYQSLYADLSGLSGLEPVAKWRLLFDLESASTLHLSLAPLGQAPVRAAIAATWWDARWMSQSIHSGSKDVAHVVEQSTTMWRTIVGDAS